MEVLGVAMFVPLLDIASPGPKSLVSEYVGRGLSHFGLQSGFSTIIILIIAILWIRGIIIFMQRSIQAKILVNWTSYFRKLSITSLYQVNYEYYAKENIGYFNNLISVEIPRATAAFSSYSTAIASLITAFVYLVGVAILDPAIAMASVVFGVFFIYVFHFTYTISGRLSKVISRQNAWLQHLTIQSTSAFRYLKSCAGFQPLHGKIDKGIDRLASCTYKQQLLRSLLESISEPIAATGALAYGYYQSQVVGANIGLVVPVIYLFYRAARQLTGFQNMWQKFEAHIGGIDTVLKALDDFERNKDTNGGIEFKELEDGIRINDVCFGYNETMVLKNISISLDKDRTVAIVGESGSGKTTVTGLVTRLITPDSGTVCYDGIDLCDLDLDSLRKRIGYVCQDSVIFQESVAFNIALVSETGCRETQAAIEKAAKLASIHDFIESLENGYDTEIGDRGITLSGGQCQRLHIARELYKKPSILILDEATSDLDSESELLIQESIDSLKGKMTTLVIAHRLSTIQHVDYIYVMAKGAVVEEGTYEELANDGGSKFYRMLKLQDAGSNNF